MICVLIRGTDRPAWTKLVTTSLGANIKLLERYIKQRTALCLISVERTIHPILNSQSQRLQLNLNPFPLALHLCLGHGLHLIKPYLVTKSIPFVSFVLKTIWFTISSVIKVGGPDRPIPEPEPQSRTAYPSGGEIAAGVSGIAATAAATQSNLYGRLTSALSERG